MGVGAPDPLPRKRRSPSGSAPTNATKPLSLIDGLVPSVVRPAWPVTAMAAKSYWSELHRVREGWVDARLSSTHRPTRLSRGLSASLRESPHVARRASRTCRFRVLARSAMLLPHRAARNRDAPSTERGTLRFLGPDDKTFLQRPSAPWTCSLPAAKRVLRPLGGGETQPSEVGSCLFRNRFRKTLQNELWMGLTAGGSEHEAGSLVDCPRLPGQWLWGRPCRE
jgi:hypothetical protein